MAGILQPMQAHRCIVWSVRSPPTTKTGAFIWLNSQTQVVCSRSTLGHGCKHALAILCSLCTSA
eukprot:11203843-Lingulodinium_polyedra.AAC.1